MLSPHEWRAIQLELLCILRNSTILWSFFFIYFLLGKMTFVHLRWIRRPVFKGIHCALTVALLLHAIYSWNPENFFFFFCSATTSKTPLNPCFFFLRTAIVNTTPVKTDSPQKRQNGNENNRLSGTVCPTHSTREKYWHKAMRLILQRRGVLPGMDLPNRERGEIQREWMGESAPGGGIKTGFWF